MNSQLLKTILTIGILALALVTTIGAMSLVATLANLTPIFGIIFALLVIVVDFLVIQFVFRINKK